MSFSNGSEAPQFNSLYSTLFMITREKSLFGWLLAAVISTIVLIYFLGPILAPFLLAAIIAYICDPLVDKLETKRFSRTAGTLLVMIFLIGLVALLLVILIPLIYKEIELLIERLPTVINQLSENVVPWLQQHFGVRAQLDINAVKKLLTTNLQGAEGAASKVFTSLKVGGVAIFGFIANLLLLPVVLFYLLRDWDIFVAKIDLMIPRRWHDRTTEIAKEVDAVLAEFLRGQLSVMAIMAIFYSVGLWFTGLEFSLPIGVLSGVLIFIPYVGAFVGLLLGTLSAFMQFGATGDLIWVWCVFAAGQTLESMVVTPWLVGDRIGLHPVAVIFALLAFGQIFGFFGILLALPASAALLVGLRHLRRDYMASQLYKKGNKNSIHNHIQTHQLPENEE